MIRILIGLVGLIFSLSSAEIAQAKVCGCNKALEGCMKAVPKDAAHGGTATASDIATYYTSCTTTYSTCLTSCGEEKACLADCKDLAKARGECEKTAKATPCASGQTASDCVKSTKDMAKACKDALGTVKDCKTTCKSTGT